MNSKSLDSFATLPVLLCLLLTLLPLSAQGDYRFSNGLPTGSCSEESLNSAKGSLAVEEWECNEVCSACRGGACMFDCWACSREVARHRTGYQQQVGRCNSLAALSAATIAKAFATAMAFFGLQVAWQSSYNSVGLPLDSVNMALIMAATPLNSLATNVAVEVQENPDRALVTTLSVGTLAIGGFVPLALYEGFFIHSGLNMLSLGLAEPTKSDVMQQVGSAVFEVGGATNGVQTALDLAFEVSPYMVPQGSEPRDATAIFRTVQPGEAVFRTDLPNATNFKPPVMPSHYDAGLDGIAARFVRSAGTFYDDVTLSGGDGAAVFSPPISPFPSEGADRSSAPVPGVGLASEQQDVGTSKESLAIKLLQGVQIGLSVYQGVRAIQQSNQKPQSDASGFCLNPAAAASAHGVTQAGRNVIGPNAPDNSYNSLYVLCSQLKK